MRPLVADATLALVDSTAPTLDFPPTPTLILTFLLLGAGSPSFIILSSAFFPVEMLSTGAASSDPGMSPFITYIGPAAALSFVRTRVLCGGANPVSRADLGFRQDFDGSVLTGSVQVGLAATGTPGISSAGALRVDAIIAPSNPSSTSGDPPVSFILSPTVGWRLPPPVVDSLSMQARLATSTLRTSDIDGNWGVLPSLLVARPWTPGIADPWRDVDEIILPGPLGVAEPWRDTDGVALGDGVGKTFTV
ncbi:hypothetical protein C8Q79DRAFT_1013188 [Trametes meyenii]|nr:hypothetical protein C8Q79DRAFT_1013188 [Trametes meyenii]